MPVTKLSGIEINNPQAVYQDLACVRRVWQEVRVCDHDEAAPRDAHRREGIVQTLRFFVHFSLF